MQVEILLKAIEKKTPQTLSNIISQIYKIFDGSFYKQFSDKKQKKILHTTRTYFTT